MREFELTPEQTVLCQQMARLASLGGFIVDLTAGRCLWCSDEVARIHGLTVADCAARLGSEQRLETWIHEDDRERYRRLRATARRQRGTYTIEYRVLNARDERLWLYETAEHLVDPATGNLRLIGSVRDLTAQRMAEEALQRANEMLERARRRAHGRAADRQGEGGSCGGRGQGDQGSLPRCGGKPGRRSGDLRR